MSIAICPSCKEETTFQLKPSFQSVGDGLVITSTLNIVCSKGHEYTVIDYSKLNEMATKIDKAWEILLEIEKRIPKLQ